MLERKRIRSITISQLEAAGIVAGGRVYNSRVYPIAATDCPALNVFTPSETGKNDRGVRHVPTFERELTLRVDIHIAAKSDTWADAGDDLAEGVIAALMQDPDFIASLGISNFSFQNTNIQASGEGADSVATIMLEFGLAYDEFYEPTVSDAFEATDIGLDAIDPADANTGHEDDPGGYPGGSPGPDGRIEGHISANPEQ